MRTELVINVTFRNLETGVIREEIYKRVSDKRGGIYQDPHGYYYVYGILGWWDVTDEWNTGKI